MRGQSGRSLVRGAAIAGRVVDDLGEPAQRVQVRAAKLRRFASEWRLIPFGESVETNDLGEYRLHGLPPGEYVVSASRRSARSGRPRSPP